MSARLGYPFVWLGIPLVLLVLFTIGPLVLLMAGGLVAGALGCTMPISATAPCLLMGIDLADALTLVVFFGYLAFFTLPVGTTALAIWLAVAVVVTLVWWLHRRSVA